MDPSSSLPNSKLYAILDELGLGFICQFESFSDQQSNQEPEFETLRGWENTKWIALSSSFFSIPALRVFYLSGTLAEPANGHANYMAYLCILTSLVSANYWRDAKRGWRRNADLILAKITFATGVYFGFIYPNSRILYRFTRLLHWQFTCIINPQYACRIATQIG